MRITFIGIAICLFYISADSGCREENKETHPVIGNWKWVKTFCCGRTSVWTNPSTCGCNKSLSINEDGTYQYFENEKETLHGEYLIRKGINDYQYETGDSSAVIQFGEDPGAYISFNDDTLLLSKGYMDMSNDYYVKQK